MTHKKDKKYIFSKESDIFISYRSNGGKEFAGRLHDRLEKEGYHVFIDVKNLNSGKYREQIFSHIKQATDFLLILSPNALDFSKRDDLFREEIEYALKLQKNIVLIKLENFEWPKQMSETIEYLKTCDSIPEDHRLFDQMITTLTTRDKSTKKKLLQSRKHWNFQKILLYFGSMFAVLTGLTIIIYFYYIKSMPVFSLSIKDQLGFIEYSDDESWSLEYVITNIGENASSVTISPKGSLNFSIVSELGDIPYRMGNITIEFTDIFADSYSYDDMNDVSVSILESNANIAGSYLAAIDSSLRENAMYIQEYALKIYFYITYTDVFGITHCDIMEPENNYNYITNGDENSYQRYLSDTTLLKCKSIDEPYMILPMMNGSHIDTDVKEFVDDLKSDETLFDIDCISHEDGVEIESYLSSYFPCSYLITNMNGLVEGVHIKHKNCVSKTN
uniref:TIR domain-containing protein n=1 Tax=Eubacterium plexicaudatum ASF492 TaxID=1235802 RepID=N2BKL8_9FIRM